MGKRAAREIDRTLRGSAAADCRVRADRRACGDQHVLSPHAGAGRRAAAGRRTAPRERHRGPDRLRSRASARRDRALLLLRHLHPVRQLRSLLPRSRGQTRGRRLRGVDRLLQGLRHLRKGVPDRLDEDGRGVAMNARDRTHPQGEADAADRQPRGRLGGPPGETEGGPALSDHAANADPREAHRIPGQRRVRCRGHHARVGALGDGRLHPGFARGRSRVHGDGVAGPAADARSCSITRAARAHRS